MHFTDKKRNWLRFRPAGGAVWFWISIGLLFFGLLRIGSPQSDAFDCDKLRKTGARCVWDKTMAGSHSAAALDTFLPPPHLQVSMKNGPEIGQDTAKHSIDMQMRSDATDSLEKVERVNFRPLNQFQLNSTQKSLNGQRFGHCRSGCWFQLLLID